MRENAGPVSGDDGPADPRLAPPVNAKMKEKVRLRNVHYGEFLDAYKGNHQRGLAGDHPTPKSNIHDGFVPRKWFVILSNEKASNLVVPVASVLP